MLSMISKFNWTHIFYAYYCNNIIIYVIISYIRTAACISLPTFSRNRIIMVLDDVYILIILYISIFFRFMLG